MTKWDDAWEAWDDVEIPKTKSTPEEPSVEVKSKGKVSGFIGFAAIAIVILAIVHMSIDDSKKPPKAAVNASSTVLPVNKTSPVALPPVNRTGPVTLPEGTWQPPSYSEQKQRQTPSRTTSRAVQDMTAEEAAVIALDGVGLPAKPKLTKEVVRTILLMKEICRADVRSSAAVLSLTYEVHAEYLDWEMAIAASTPPRATAENIVLALLVAIHEEILSNLTTNNCGVSSSSRYEEPQEHLLPITKYDGTPCLGSDMRITCPEPWARTQRTFDSDFYDLMGWHCQTTKRYCVTTSGGEGCMCQKLKNGASKWRVVR